MPNDAPGAKPDSDEGALETSQGPIDAQLYDTLIARKHELETMPDGPRTKADGVRYKRRTVLVDWNLQLSYLGVYLGTLTLLGIGFAALNMIFASLYNQAIRIQMQNSFDDETNALFLVVLNVVFVIMLVIGMAVYAIIQSHRVAGPAMRFRRALHAMARRDYDWYLALRSKDYMQDIATQVNELNNLLKAKDAVIVASALELDEIARTQPEAASRLTEVSASLNDVVTQSPLPEGEASRV
ncbi:MAG: hypothetical protein JKY65_19940 [Planctomycetes bacterium]|nr:hypothetical protein [Planctomycetota bacterium]